MPKSSNRNISSGRENLEVFSVSTSTIFTEMKSSVTGEISKFQTVINCPMWEKEEIQGTKGQEKKFIYCPLVCLFLKMINVPWRGWRGWEEGKGVQQTAELVSRFPMLKGK